MSIYQISQVLKASTTTWMTLDLEMQTRLTMASPGTEALNRKPPSVLVSLMKSSDVAGGDTVTKGINGAISHLPTHPKASGHQASSPWSLWWKTQGKGEFTQGKINTVTCESVYSIISPCCCLREPLLSIFTCIHLPIFS